MLRPQAVADARKRHFEVGDLSAEELAEIEDDAIRENIRYQQDIGMPAITDGEARRSFWHYDFMGMLHGLDLVERDEGVQFAGVKLRRLAQDHASARVEDLAGWHGDRCGVSESWRRCRRLVR